MSPPLRAASAAIAAKTACDVLAGKSVADVVLDGAGEVALVVRGDGVECVRMPVGAVVQGDAVQRGAVTVPMADIQEIKLNPRQA